MELLAQRFELQRKLGHGGLATVYLAKDLAGNNELAIKLIHEHLAEDPIIRERFGRELTLTRQARHPGIVEQYEFHQDGPRCFIAMEYMAGGDLRGRLNRLGAMPIRPTIKLSLEVLEALGHAHGKGIIHRDIKPHNILFTADDRAKLSDFGLARGAGGEGFASSTINAGTPEYSPPELVLGHFTDARSDLYSFGITLYEALCGRLPFSGNSSLEILYAQANTAPPDPRSFVPDLPDSLVEIILKALAKDPLDRYQSAADFAKALDGVYTVTRQPIVQVVANGATRRRCVNCGRSIDGLSAYCHFCKRPDSSLLAALQSHTGVDIVITGPGAVGSKLDDEYRQAILPLMSVEDNDCRLLEKKLPRLPFTLAKNVEAASASQLAAELRGLGLDVLVSENKTSGKAVRQAFHKKNITLIPRIWAMMAGVSVGAWNSIIKGLERLGLGVSVIVLCTLFTVTSLLAAFDLRKAWIKPAQKRVINDFRSALAASLRTLNGKLVSPAFQGLAHTVGLKLESLSDPAYCNIIEKAERPAFIKMAQDWVELCLAGQELEAFLRQRSEAAIRQEIRQLEKKNQTTPADDVLWQQLSGLTAELNKRRDIELSLDRLFDRLLDFNSRLENLCLGLASAQAADTKLQLGSLQTSIQDAGDLIAAARSAGVQEKP